MVLLATRGHLTMLEASIMEETTVAGLPLTEHLMVSQIMRRRTWWIRVTRYPTELFLHNSASPQYYHPGPTQCSTNGWKYDLGGRSTRLESPRRLCWLEEQQFCLALQHLPYWTKHMEIHWLPWPFAVSKLHWFLWIQVEIRQIWRGYNIV